VRIAEPVPSLLEIASSAFSLLAMTDCVL